MVMDSYCVSCEALKVEIAILKDEYDEAVKSSNCATCKDLAKENNYFKKTLERFTSGEKNLNLILDKSKVSVKNSGLGFNSLEHSRSHPPKITRAVESGLFEVEPSEPSKIVFRSAGFAQPHSYKKGAYTSSGQTPQKVKYHCTFCKKDGQNLQI